MNETTSRVLEIADPTERASDMFRPIAARDLVCALALVAPRELSGFVADPQTPGRRFVVELRLDGEPAGLARAELFEPELAAEGIGDGCYGFAFTLPAGDFEAETAGVVIANTDVPVGAPITLGPSSLAVPIARSHVAWTGGLSLAGWVEARGDLPMPVAAFVDGQCVARADASVWELRKRHAAVGSALRFEIYLPERFADGAVHRVHVYNGDGQELSGSPCSVAAFPDGLEALIRRQAPRAGEELRGRFFDLLCPRSLPFDQFGRWRQRFPREQMFSGASVKVAVVLIGERDIETTLGSLESQTDCEWIAVSLQDEGDGVAFSPAALTEFLDDHAASSGVVVFARSGTRFAPTALGDLAGALAEAPGSGMAYCDLAIRSSDGSVWPLAFTAFDYERMLEQGYAAQVFALRVDLVRDALRGGAQDLFRMAAFALDGAPWSSPRHGVKLIDLAPLHCPGFLAEVELPEPASLVRRLKGATLEHLRTAGLEGVEVVVGHGSLFPAVHLRCTSAVGRLTIVTPAIGSREAIRERLSAARQAAAGLDFEVLLISEFRDAEFEAQASSELRVLHVDGPVSLERCANWAATAASGEFLLFFDPSMDGIEAVGLRDLLGRISSAGAAAVGPALWLNGGARLAAGYALGANFAATPRILDPGGDVSAYGDLGQVAHEVSAVPLAGMLTRTRALRELDGLDLAHFRRHFADVDYCLRLRSAGYRVICDPRVRWTASAKSFFEPALPTEKSGPMLAATDNDLAHLRARWGETLLNDPFYNPLLSLAGEPYRGLAWPPRSQRVRTPATSPPRVSPRGF